MGQFCADTRPSLIELIAPAEALASPGMDNVPATDRTSSQVPQRGRQSPQLPNAGDRGAWAGQPRFAVAQPSGIPSAMSGAELFSVPEMRPVGPTFALSGLEQGHGNSPSRQQGTGPQRRRSLATEAAIRSAGISLGYMEHSSADAQAALSHQQIFIAGPHGQFDAASSQMANMAEGQSVLFRTGDPMGHYQVDGQHGFHTVGASGYPQPFSLPQHASQSRNPAAAQGLAMSRRSTPPLPLQTSAGLDWGGGSNSDVSSTYSPTVAASPLLNSALPTAPATRLTPLAPMPIDPMSLLHPERLPVFPYVACAEILAEARAPDILQEGDPFERPGRKQDNAPRKRVRQGLSIRLSNLRS